MCLILLLWLTFFFSCLCFFFFSSRIQFPAGVQWKRGKRGSERGNVLTVSRVILVTCTCVTWSHVRIQYWMCVSEVGRSLASIVHTVRHCTVQYDIVQRWAERWSLFTHPLTSHWYMYQPSKVWHSLSPRAAVVGLLSLHGIGKKTHYYCTVPREISIVTLPRACWGCVLVLAYAHSMSNESSDWTFRIREFPALLWCGMVWYDMLEAKKTVRIGTLSHHKIL